MDGVTELLPQYLASPDLISEALDSLLRGKSNALDAYLTTVTSVATIDKTKASVHCHCIRNDGNENPRFRDLARCLAERVVDYAIPRSEIKLAQKQDLEDNTTANVTALTKKAKALFADIGTTGEGGELLLYLLTQTHLKIPQLLCKMPLKTNSQMYYHGVDGVHATFDSGTNKLLLYWGESKLYQDLNAAISKCFEGLSIYLNDSGGTGSPLERDIFLLQDNLDLIDPQLEEALLHFLDRNSPGFNSVEYRGVALIGFDSEHYPTSPHTKTTKQVCDDLVVNHTKWLASLKTAIGNHTPLERFSLEIFLLPFPDVQSFRDAFLKELGHAKPNTPT
jgi:Cap4 SAVED domain